MNALPKGLEFYKRIMNLTNNKIFPLLEMRFNGPVNFTCHVDLSPREMKQEKKNGIDKERPQPWTGCSL